MLSLNQRLSQLQKLSPQQIQYQKLLQLNTLSLEQRIKTELELNPILEETLLDDYELEVQQDEDKPDEEIKETSSDDEGDEDSFDSSEDNEFGIEDYMNDSEIDIDYHNRSSEEEKIQPIAPARETLTEHLLEQLHVLALTEELFALGEEIIGNLDEDGYLKRDLESIRDELNMFQHIEISAEDAEKLQKKYRPSIHLELLRAICRNACLSRSGILLSILIILL